ncbi:MAG TPA: thiamine phosphate synthase [Candidatus Sulfotelmatobacter sp.]|nr:thiamine phosphate synthase [Candidatus Sulfotelmatobacter sp.]
MRIAEARLCVITDPGLAPGHDHAAVAAAALAGGADVIQLRDKSGSLRDLLRQARTIRILCQQHGALFVVNDRVDLALAADADGAHVGQEDLPAAVARGLLGGGRLLGVSTHSVEQARAAREAGADYIGFGPLFPTGSKATGYTSRGLAGLAAVRAAVGDLPILAIGGITLETARDVIRAGATAPAVISAVVAAPEIAAAAAAFVARVREAGTGRRAEDLRRPPA